MGKTSVKKYLVETTFVSLLLFQISASTLSNYNRRTYLIKLAADLMLLLTIIIPKDSKRAILRLIKSSFNKNQFIHVFIILLLLIYPLITVSYSLNAEFGFQKWLNILMGPGFSIMGTYFLCRTMNSTRVIIIKYIFIFTGIISSIIAITLHPFPYDGKYSITDFKWSHVIFGRYLAMVFIFLYIYLIKAKSRKEILIIGPSLILIAFGIYFTSLRASILGLAVIIPLMILSAIFKKESLINVSSGTLIFFCSIFLILAYSNVYENKLEVNRTNKLSDLENIQETSDPAFLSRIQAYSIAFERIKENPLLGLGFGGFRTYYESDLPLWIKYPHNIFLEAQVEMGIGGTILILIILYFIFTRSYQISIFIFYFFLFAFILSLFSKDIPSQSMLLMGLGVMKRPIPLANLNEDNIS